MGKLMSTIVTVVVAVGLSALIWVLANLWFNQVRNNWDRFVGIVYGIVGFVLGVVLHGNHVLVFSEPSDDAWDDGLVSDLGVFLQWFWPPLALGLLFAVLGTVVGRTTDARQRLMIATGGFTVIGVGLGALMDEDVRPDLAPGPLIGWTVAGAVIGGGISLLRKRAILGGALIGGAVGWVLGGWGSADIGEGTIAESIIATAVPAIAIGLRVGLGKRPDLTGRINLDRRSRAVIFLAPALLFIFVTLVIPALRTLYLSFYDKNSVERVGFDNYTATFRDRKSFDADNWSNMVGSQLFWIGAVFIVIAIFMSARQKQLTGKAVELGGGSLAPWLAGGLFVLFAAFTAFRGTIINNLWWVVTVTLFSTSLGLAVAVLADNAKGEKAAKSIIFMPMAISLVGASIIWRFMYIPRDASENQTGVLNALWVGLGKLSTGSGLPTIIVGVLIGVAVVLLLAALARALVRKEWGRAAVPGIAALLLLWLFVRDWGIIGDGVGGFVIRPDGTIVGRPVGFIQESPFNNFWLMVILIWIQTGFAMVILSAAIKAVPTEYLEAARVDGATESQIFWRVTLPQIGTTIGVVVTTLVVLVMKVFDIVKVVTNGNFGTQVLANNMYQEAFQFGNTGRGAALAMLILLSVLPVMYMNIRRMQREG